MKIYDITIGEIVNECNKRDNWSLCAQCKYFDFCESLAIRLDDFYGYFKYMENVEVDDVN